MLSKTRGSPVGPAAPGVSPDSITGPAGPGSPAAAGTETPSVELDPRRTYSCAGCGHVLRITGIGRHRVYFELADEALDDPVMNRVCPACGLRLPGK